MQVIYAGTPEFAVPALHALIHSRHEVLAVYTRPDQRAGRGKKLRASAVKQAAVEAGLPVVQPVSLRDGGEQARLATFRPDLMVVAAYGLILPLDVLQTPRLGCINIHASLLPRWRGAAPIHRAILSGDTETGITIMQMAEGLDTGDILLRKTLPITTGDTTASLHDKLAETGARALLQTLDLMDAGRLTAENQDNALATYAKKLEKREAEIDWRHSAEAIHRQIRAFNPWPVAQTTSTAGILRIWAAEPATRQTAGEPGQVLEESKAVGILVQTGAGALWLHRIQLPGGKPVSAADFLNARSLKDECLGHTA